MTAKQLLKNSFFISLPAFGVLHHYFVNYPAVSWTEACLLFAVHIVCLAAFLFCFYLISRDWSWSAVMSTLTLLFFLVFGNIADAASGWIPIGSLPLFLGVIVAGICLLVLAGRLLRYNTNIVRRTAFFLALLFPLWIVADILQTLPAFRRVNRDQVFLLDPKALSNDVNEFYLLALDGYPSNEVLKQLFDFDNSKFENELKKRGFHVTEKSFSNYDQTSFSIASMLTLEYLPLANADFNNQDYAFTTYQIAHSPLIRLFEQQGFETINFSVFHTGGTQPAPNSYTRRYPEEYLGRTLPGRLLNLLNNRSNPYLDREYNQSRIDDIMKLPDLDSGKKRLVYLHLLMPHYPYFFDSSGKEINEKAMLAKENFISYLVYSNNNILSVIDKIQRTAEKEVVYLFSDHGHRDENAGRHTYFQNLSAVYSEHRPVKFPDGMSNLNQMRSLLNQTMGQRLPFLRDTTIAVFK